MIRKRQNEGSGSRFEIVARGYQRSIEPARVCSRSAWRWGQARVRTDGNYEFKIMNYRKPTWAVALALLALAFIIHNSSFAYAQTRTTVADTIHGPDGSQPSGRIVITSRSTFTAPDGTVVFSGVVATATVTNGSFSVSLVPNAGSTPSGTSYSAIYKLAGVPYREETWIVPSSPNPAALSDVRTSAPPSPVTTFNISQVLPPANCAAGGGFAKYTSSGWTCAAGGGNPAGSSGQVEINNNGAFGGAASLTYDSTSGATTLKATDKGGQVFNVRAYGAKGDGSTDDTSAVNAAFAAAYAAGGGVIYFPPGTYLIAGALTIPNDGAAQPKQPPYRIEGASMDGNSSGWGGSPSHGSILVMTETADALGKIDTRGGGYMEIDHVSFMDTDSDAVPFIFTTNTILHVHDCSFTSSQTGTANVQDAIILGGSNPAHIHTGDADSPFQGYGTVIRDNYFNRVRHAVVGNTYANAVQIVENTVGQGSGSSTAGDAPFVFVGYGPGADGTTGGYVSGNLMELHNYYYGVRLAQYAENFTMLGNNAYDQGANTVATYYLGTGSDTEIMSCGQVAGACLDTSSPGASAQNYTVFSTYADASGFSSYIGNHPYFPHGFTIKSGQNLVLQTLAGGDETRIFEQSYKTYIRPNNGVKQSRSDLDSAIDANGQWGILNTAPAVAFDVKGALRTRPVAFASAPACSSTIEGSMQAISDSTTATWGATITGGGTNHVLAYCDGTAWTVMGK